MIDVNTELELAKLRSLVGDLRDMMSAERPDGWESMPMWGGGGGVDYSIFAFGCVKVDDASVDVYPGEVQHASSYFNSAKTTAGVSGGSLANPRYICGLYVRGSSLTILPDALATKPVSNDTNFYFWISSWYHTNAGVLTLLRINHNNAIIIPNLWAI